MLRLSLGSSMFWSNLFCFIGGSPKTFAPEQSKHFGLPQSMACCLANRCGCSIFLSVDDVCDRAIFSCLLIAFSSLSNRLLCLNRSCSVLIIATSLKMRNNLVHCQSKKCIYPVVDGCSSLPVAIANHSSVHLCTRRSHDPVCPSVFWVHVSIENFFDREPHIFLRFACIFIYALISYLCHFRL